MADTQTTGRDLRAELEASLRGFLLDADRKPESPVPCGGNVTRLPSRPARNRRP
jgi:hypothetical protein